MSRKRSDNNIRLHDIQGGWKQVSLIQVAKAKLVSLKLWHDSSFFFKTFFGNKLRFFNFFFISLAFVVGIKFRFWFENGEI